MYQKQAYVNQSEKDFNNLYQLFNDNILNMENEVSHNESYDMNGLYIIGNISPWHEPFTLGKKCTILQKNNKIAVVKFHLDNEAEIDSLAFLHTIFKLSSLRLLKTK